MQQDDKTPYDTLWTWLGSFLLSVSVWVILAISTGASSLAPDPNAVVQDDRKATIAFWGLLFCAFGLTALGRVACGFASTPHARRGLTWPRFQLLEGKTRVLLVARLSLAVVVTLPFFALVVALVAYLDTSRIAMWDAEVPLASGFISSRATAFSTACSQQPCFRLAPKDGIEPFAHQWAIWSDALILLALVSAAVAWGTFCRRALRFD